MNLHCRLPDPVRAALADRLGLRGTPRYAAESDLTLDRRFGQSYLVVADGHIAACDCDGTVHALNLAEIKEVKVDELFGGGRLVAVLPTGERHLIAYTKAHVPAFAAMCRAINDLTHDRTPVLPDEAEHAYCQRCGAPLPERGVHCPKCVPKAVMFRRLLGLLRPYKRAATMLMVLTFVTVGTQIVPPLLTKMIVDDVIEGKNLHRLRATVWQD